MQPTAELEPVEPFLESSFYIDADAPAIQRFARDHAGTGDDLSRAVWLYYAVRDGIRYNPYAVGVEPASFRASAVLAAGEGWCVPKAVLLAAVCRASGIPARLGFADVRNHLSTERLRESMETEIFYFHGYTTIFLEGRWVKATPAFNRALCDKFGLRPLEFNGREDSIYHEFDQAGNRHMEYLNDRGEYPDLPFDDIMAVFREHYPRMMAQLNAAPALAAGDWQADVEREIAR
ncbi:transglutaminase family protein [Seongchinamella sediminis]|uniref:Transglutaminase family protein n=1 Tax=Seongchinamella sediminis TaxID=2283635 RepID=A0A3L7E426_9GAMM|nr:transglutaminase family protein [Seongchinamella sediminis]RLQ23132.1 transglutaminase family protein [Seongchinamella sediminis]